jgi:hypothetical protein
MEPCMCLLLSYNRFETHAHTHMLMHPVKKKHKSLHDWICCWRRTDWWEILTKANNANIDMFFFHEQDTPSSLTCHTGDVSFMFCALAWWVLIITKWWMMCWFYRALWHARRLLHTVVTDMVMWHDKYEDGELIQSASWQLVYQIGI